MKKTAAALLAAALTLTLAFALPPAPALANTGPMPKAIYTGVAQTSLFIRTVQSTEASSVGNIPKGSRVHILGYEPDWLIVAAGTDKQWVTGYVLRRYVSEIRQIDETALPYGTTPARFIGTIARDTQLFIEPDRGSEAFFNLTTGTKVAILEIEDGWAKVIYWRLFGYFRMEDVEDLLPVYSPETAAPGDWIAGFVSFYNMSEEDINQNRISNIKLASENIAITMEPGFVFSFDEIAGPYRGDRGYLEALSFYEGDVVPSYGGGVCQVSSTLHNVLLALPQGIDITQRRAHGPSGVLYLPHGVDAAVGNIANGINLVFQNTFPFSIDIETHVQDGALFIAFRKAQAR